MACPLDAALDTRIIVVVNKDAITAADVEQRIRLVNLGAGRPTNDPVPDEVRKQVIEEMVNECLQLQAAKAKKIVISDAEVEKTLESLASDNKMSLDAMVKMLKSNGISKQTMMTRLRAQISWGRYIREMYGPLVHIADVEIDTALSKAKEVKVEEPSPELMDITLCQAVFDVTPETPEAVMMLLGPKIEETHQAKGCPAFLNAAKGFGAKVQANQIVKLGQLPGPLKAMVHKTKTGTCMQPTMTPEGLVLTMVCSKTMPKVAPPPVLTRDMASSVVEQQKLGKRATQEMAKLKSVAFIEWKAESAQANSSKSS
ncbi:MAG: SurA N-terminal domain-containing protein [Alphaproteobacteria bacterium]|nr:SurA N-terminal domain-containing protein [Alphaproteobacteria bacterium]